MELREPLKYSWEESWWQKGVYINVQQNAFSVNTLMCGISLVYSQLDLHLMDQGRKEMFYLTMHWTHFIYGYMASDIWLRTILIVRMETRCHHMGYSFRLAARVLLYAPSHRQDSTNHGLCYTSRGALAGTTNSSMGPPYEASIRRPIAPWVNALPLSYVPLPDIEPVTWTDLDKLKVFSGDQLRRI